jgi:hypothetical protein
MLFHLHITYRMWMANILSILWNFLVSRHQWSIEKKVRWLWALKLGHFSVSSNSIYSISVALSKHRCMSTNSVNEQPLSMLDQYVMCFCKLRFLQTDLINYTLQYYIFGVKLSGTVNINTVFTIKWTSVITTQTQIKYFQNISFFTMWQQE